MTAAHAARMDGFVAKPCQAAKLLGLAKGLLAQVAPVAQAAQAARSDDGDAPGSRRRC
jgi:hypothetical protein